MIKKILICYILTMNIAHASAWECINRNVLISTCNTWRMSTPQGWLVSTDNGNKHISLAYVPDQDHDWKV